MLETGWFRSAENWVEANVLGADEFANFGFAMALVLCAILAFLLVTAAGKLLTSLNNAAGVRAFRKSRDPGYRVLVALPTGRGARRLGRWLNDALKSHLTEFNFGAPLRLGKTGAIDGGLDPKALARARKRLAAADADMLVWATRTGPGSDGFVIHGLSRGGGLRPDEARAFTIALPGRRNALQGQMPRVAAYLLAKQLQPALANPQAFRPEKMKLLASALDKMLLESDTASQAIQNELEADFCASAVHVAETNGDLDLLDRVIALRRVHLFEVNNTTDPALVSQARMDLGRALLARATKQYDQQAVQEAISHLSQVVDALRGDPAIQKAQTASDAMYKAQSLIETRKRFSLNFGS
jgi:hypothetical protein